MAEHHYIYILLLGNGQLYTGYTAQLERRISEHQRGRVTSTARRQPVELLHAERYLLKTDAQRRERFLKTTEGKKLLRQQIRDLLALRGVIE